MDISVALNNARLEATRDFADLGTGNSTILLYSTTQPLPGAAEAADPLVTITLAKPCGSLISNLLVLEQDAPAGDLIVNTGAALWGRWINGNGDWMADGDVTDESGAGDFKVVGTAGTTLYAGGKAILGDTGLA
jgi:hypothetical protein